MPTRRSYRFAVIVRFRAAVLALLASRRVLIVGDSKQLGFGPPLATAAAQRVTYSFTVPASAQAGDLYTFYCRIHPDMRGSLEVVG